MNKINVKIDIDNIIFSLSKDDDDRNLNYTNVINPKKIKFSEEYIINNISSTAVFFNEILKKEKVDKVLIKNMEIAETVLTLIKYMPKIKKVYFLENKKLSYTISNKLLENRNINYVNCYTMPEVVFNKFNKGIIELRYDYFFVSHFMEINKIDTYSKLYYKKIVIIDKKLEKYDKEDFVEFLGINKHLKKIEIVNYNKDDLIIILENLKEYEKNNVIINIWQNDSNTNLLMNSIKEFNSLEKKYNVVITIKYSKEYKEKNIVKQVNINMLRIIIIVIIIIAISIVLLFNYIKAKDNKKVQKITDEIDKVIEETTTEEIKEEEIETEEIKEIKPSPYFTNYTRVLSELLKINDNTVGWLNVKNTKVNYPIVQYTDNDYYLNRDYNKDINLGGWIFVDYRNNMKTLSQNTIIYGHNVDKTDLMFSTLTKTINESWYKNSNNQIITLDTLNGSYSFQIFSIYKIPETNDYLITDFSSGKSFMNYIDMVKNRSVYNFNIEIKETDKILTLSTCYGGNSDNRIVIHAKKI